jgi:hypothetical protein
MKIFVKFLIDLGLTSERGGGILIKWTMVFVGYIPQPRGLGAGLRHPAGAVYFLEEGFIYGRHTGAVRKSGVQ